MAPQTGNQGVGFRVCGVQAVQGLGLKVWGLGPSRVAGSGFGLQYFGCGVNGSGFRAWFLGFGVWIQG